MHTWALTLAIIAVVLSLLALVVAVRAFTDQRAAQTVRTTRAPRPAPVKPARVAEDGSPVPLGPGAFVINPSKVSDVAGLEETARVMSRELGLPDPLFFHTTPEDPGGAQAREALAAGASVVIAAGGDGTVREVATVMAGTDVPMALVPAGTGNLLARNLDLPLSGHEALVQTALSGREMAIDLGWIRAIKANQTEEEAPESAFLVMAGVGFDAAMVAGADDELKRRIGWFAYFAVGMRHLLARKTRLAMHVGNGAWQSFRVRTLLIANCGRLPGGIVLLPEAELDDGYLDVAAIDTRVGLIGWGALVGQVALQGLGIRPRLPYEASSIAFWRGRSVQVTLDHPQQVQVDGDLLGESVELRVRVQEAALRVRVRH